MEKGQVKREGGSWERMKRKTEECKGKKFRKNLRVWAEGQNHGDKAKWSLG